jgi:hypothetical protein
MRNPKLNPIILFLFALCLLAGCVASTTYNGALRPDSPKPHFVQFFFPTTVDSLHPTFKWHATDSTRQADLGIWDAVYKGSGPRNNSGSYVLGHLVYYQANLAVNEHEITTNLAPNTIYFWSIRPSGTRQWASANHSGSLGGFEQWGNGFPFSIITPSE